MMRGPVRVSVECVVGVACGDPTTAIGASSPSSRSIRTSSPPVPLSTFVERG